MADSDSDDESDESPSAEQMAWTELADAIREGLRKVAVERLAKMEPAQIRDFASACEMSYWLAHNAHAWDAKIAAERDKDPGFD